MKNIHRNRLRHTTLPFMVCLVAGFMTSLVGLAFLLFSLPLVTQWLVVLLFTVITRFLGNLRVGSDMDLLPVCVAIGGLPLSFVFVHVGIIHALHPMSVITVSTWASGIVIGNILSVKSRIKQSRRHKLDSRLSDFTALNSIDPVYVPVEAISNKGIYK